ncbi:MAG: hypothetical protein F6K14_18485 [Symploca sp. SIO2C1]|nr:hypothetical protein [Symploca sp. SIO2C1]
MRTSFPLSIILAKISRDFNNLEDHIQQRNPVWYDNFGNTITDMKSRSRFSPQCQKNN